MTLTEKFIKATITRITRNVGHEEDELRKILATDLTHEGKRYALKIVELDAELPHNPYEGHFDDTKPLRNGYIAASYQGFSRGLTRMKTAGWVKGVSE